VKVGVCIPSQDMVHAGFMFDLVRLTSDWSTRFGTDKGDGTHDILDVYNGRGTLIADQREALVDIAMASDCDAILWLDSDMRFPKDMLELFIMSGQDIIAANYTTRRPPLETVAFANYEDLQRVPTTKKSKGMQEVAAVGMGCMFVRMDVYRALKKPYFMIGYSHGATGYVGEDIYFCKAAQAAGFKVMIDHDISKAVRHIGTFEFSHEQTEAWES
jgi:hypothetical protein